MQRILTDVDIGDHQTRRKRYRLVINDDPSGPDRQSIQMQLFRFMQALVDQPNLLQCGMGYPDKFAIHHNGNNFVLQTEVEVDQP